MGDIYVRLYTTFLNHKKIVRAARELQIPCVQMRGHIVTLWTNVQLHYPDGILDNCDNDDIALYSEWDGDADFFVNALEKFKLVTRDTNGQREINDWSEHCGLTKMSKIRTQNKLRKRAERDRKREKQQQNQYDTEMSRVTVTQSHDVTVERERDKDLDLSLVRARANEKLNFGSVPKFPITTPEDFELLARQGWNWDYSRCKFKDAQRREAIELLSLSPMTKQESELVKRLCVDDRSPWINMAIHKLRDIRKPKRIAAFEKRQTIQDVRESNIRAIERSARQIAACGGGDPLLEAAKELDRLNEEAANG